MNDKTREWVDEQVAAQPKRPRGRRRPRLLRGRPGPVRVHTALPPGKCSTVPSLLSICVSVLQSAATDELSEKCAISCQFKFQSSILRCSNGFQMGNDSRHHLIPNLQFNLQIKMPKLKLRSEMGLLNTLQNYPVPGEGEEGEAWIAVIRRGGCTFNEKIRNVLALNASGVLIYDNEASGESMISICSIL